MHQRDRAFSDDAALLMAGMVAALERRSRDLGCSRIHFLTREGLLIQRAWEAWRAGRPGTAEGRTLWVSRRSSFAAGWDDLGPDLLRVLGRQYPVMTARAFCASLAMDDGLAARIHGAAPDRPVRPREDDPWIQALCADVDRSGLLRTHFSELRRRLRLHLHTADLPEDGKAILCDIGWRGSIQDNLARILPDCRLHGVYLGLQASLDGRVQVEDRISAGMDHRDPSPARGILALPTPLELLFTPPCGSVVGYAADGAPELGPTTPVPGFIAEVQEQMVQRAPGIAERLIMDAGDGRSALTAAAWRIVASPSPGMSEAFRAIVHDETFGTGVGAWRPAQRFPWMKVLAAPFHRPHRTALVHWLIDQKWPQAILDSPARTPMRWMFNRALAKM